MGFVLAIAPCVHCGETFRFNPMTVPSVVVDGVREPLCRPCVEWANLQREQRGLQPWTIAPDAYAPIDETGMVWG